MSLDLGKTVWPIRLAGDLIHRQNENMNYIETAHPISILPSLFSIKQAIAVSILGRQDGPG